MLLRQFSVQQVWTVFNIIMIVLGKTVRVVLPVYCTHTKRFR